MMNRIAAAFGVALFAGSALAYEAQINATFQWGTDGIQIGWTANGVNSLPEISNNTRFRLQGGNNSTSYFNSDFAIASDYGPGPNDDCLTLAFPSDPTPWSAGYDTISLRKYSCRQTDDSLYYSAIYHAAPPTDAGGGAAATGLLLATDTSLTGTLFVITTTDEPTGASVTNLGNVRVSNSVGNGFDGYNLRTADGSPFGNAWYGVTTSATLSVNLTGVFSSQQWFINGGSVTFNDPGFACQQGGFSSGSSAGILCTPSSTAGGFSPNAGHLSWGMDTDGSASGIPTADPIEVRDISGSQPIAILGGVLADVSIDGSGNLTTNHGEYRIGQSFSSCNGHIRFRSPADGGVTGISCGVLSVGALNIVGSTGDGVPDSEPDPFSFADALDVGWSRAVKSNSVQMTGINVPAPISVSEGEYSLGCSSLFTSADGVIAPAQPVCVRHTSAASPDTSVTTMLTVGGVTGSFTSTTAICDTAPEAFDFADLTDISRNAVVESNSITVTQPCGENTSKVISVSGAPTSAYSINGGSWWSTPGTIEVGDTVRVRHTSSSQPSTTVSTTLTIDGVSADFTSTTAVIPPGEIPNAVDDVVTAQAGKQTIIEILANDTGLDATPLNVFIIGYPGYGNLTMRPDFSLVYNHYYDWYYPATDFIFYRIVAANGLSDDGFVRINIVEPVGPRAYDDSAEVFGTVPVSINVLANDQRLTAPPLTVTISRAPYDGTALVSGAGDAADIFVSYQANADSFYYSYDSFEYTVTDANGNSDVGYVQIYRRPKIARDDVATVSSNGSVVIYVAQNDTMPYEYPMYGQVNIGIWVTPQNGIAVAAPSTGYSNTVAITYTPNPGFVGEDSFQYAIDNERRMDFATVRVTVVADVDLDGVEDSVDNCVNAANPDQRDSNGDNYGNICDADLNNDGVVNVADVVLFRQRFGTTDPHADFNGSGFVNFADLTILRQYFGRPPGPSALVF